MPDTIPLKDLIDAISGNVPEGTDWDSLIAATNYTLTTGMLAANLLDTDREADVPAEAREFLAEILRRTAERNERLRAQLAEAVEELNRHGVEPLLIKGAAIMQTVGAGEYRGRILADLDLMVPPQAMKTAAGALAAIGYRCPQPSPDADCPSVWERSRDVGPIDLHRQLKPARPALGFDCLMAGAAETRIAGGRAWLPSPTMQVAILIAHDQLQDRDYWRGSVDLRHLFDCKWLEGSAEGIDWKQLGALFSAGFPQSAFRTHCITARELLGVSVPAEFCKGWRPRLQYRRRLLQARWPAIIVPATIASVLADAPFRLNGELFRMLMKRLSGRDRGSAKLTLLVRLQRRLGSFFGSRSVGKI